MKKRRSGLVPTAVRVRRAFDPIGRETPMLSITLDDCEPPGPNGPRGSLQTHWAQRKREKDLLQLLVRAGINSSPDKPLRFDAPVVIAYERSYRNEPMDPDNLAASFKPLLDVIVRCGIIKDDSPKWIKLTATQAKRVNGKAQTRVCIWLDPSR